MIKSRNFKVYYIMNINLHYYKKYKLLTDKVRNKFNNEL